ncbi:hypothetical protein E3N88_28118 [Mikania micrantha]|uniref:Uncharacterized protein n=1 Tax=Mikania micrantha TaxID=192012 RepID=A0A5N6MZT2_9ASTR|nr:hypothetical protein E3N88_28118 [Mikania micrantha]
MVNVGENRARNGVTNCPESRNEDKIEKWTNLAALHPARYAPAQGSAWGDAPDVIKSRFLPKKSIFHLEGTCLSVIINNINYLKTIKTMSLVLDIQKDLINKRICYSKERFMPLIELLYESDFNLIMIRHVDYVSPVEEVLYMYEPVNFRLAVEVSCIYTSLSTSGRQLRCLVLHKPVDFRSTVEAKFPVQGD